MSVVRVKTLGSAVVVITSDGEHIYCYPGVSGLYYPRKQVTVDPDPDPDPDPPAGDWIFPFPDASITSPYGPRWGDFHYGTDWGNPDAYLGAPIYCIGAGTVEDVGVDTYGGLYVTVNHGNIPGYGIVRSLYVHQNDEIQTVGNAVTAGSLIAHVGYSGWVEPPGAAGAHLHLQINQNNTTWNTDTVDPIAFLNAMGAVKP